MNQRVVNHENRYLVVLLTKMVMKAVTQLPPWEPKKTEVEKDMTRDW